MKRTFRRRGAVLAAALVLLCAVSFADRGGPASFAATGWALLPPAVAIVLAFATKEVYSSLLAGCVVGALLTEGFAPWRSFETLFLTLMEGIDLKIFFFDVLLGAIVVLFARSGGSRAFGEWASRRVRSRRGAVTATAGLGCLIFLDDYFNCLTVGAIMQPITDRCRVSREKLSFIIDATAAPVCILAPISSWAAAVSSYIPADYSHVNGFALFIQAIPYNFYALLMLWLVFLVALTGRDFGPMYRREQLAIRQEPPRPETAPEGRDRPRGRAVDLLLPTACLIVAVVWGMAVLGRRSCREAGLALTASNVFANTDAPMALCFGCSVTLLVMALLYIPRGVMSFSGFVEGFLDGFKLITPALLVLTFAWGLKSFAARLDTAAFVRELFDGRETLTALFPLALFLVGEMLVVSIAACLSGAVCGDHCSPISDTTIMASAGAHCSHVNHVSTQLPYAITAAACSAVCYVITGLAQAVLGSRASLVTSLVLLVVAIVLELAVLSVIRARTRAKTSGDAV